jgi:hypothetical protein
VVGKVLNWRDISRPDALGTTIANQWCDWFNLSATKRASWEEVRKYVYATDTTQTSNSALPWKNSTTIPKLCQIRDNLYANYHATIFPNTKRKWLTWDASQKDANQKDKRDAILNYMAWAVQQDRFKKEVAKLILDFIDYGNAFAMPEWVDERSSVKDQLKGTTGVGYVGPTLRRISPLDIVFNPTAPSFLEAPKIIRSIVSIGEVKKILDSQSTPEDAQAYQELYDYLLELRQTIRNHPGYDLQVQDAYYQMDGFTSFRSYLESDYVEILTFYGDIFDWDKKELLQNHKIMVVDRHKVISQKVNPSYFGYPPVFHVGWRPRQDNLWAMGPLDNLVGLQYRVDHIENLKADVFDLLTFPPLKVKGFVEDFNWGPMERIYMGDEGDVEMMAPPFQILQANIEIGQLLQTMEEMAGAPREAMGFRTPGEKTMYEVQRLENAASRIFTTRIIQFEEFLEQTYNSLLELGRRHMSEVQEISVFDDEFKIQTFMSLTPQDITGAGRLKPIAARHFAEKAEIVQNISAFYASGPGQDPDVRMHLSGINTAKLFEELLSLQDFQLVQPYVRLTEQADAMRMQNAAQEQVTMEAQTPSGLTPDDVDPEMGGMPGMPGMGPA